MKIENTDCDARHGWPDEAFLQGRAYSRELRRPNGTGFTAFVEVFTDGTFIRGEGASVADAEDDAWAQFQRFIACPGHEYEARHYRNGAGICARCGRFQSNVFTPEQLGCYCRVCGIPSYYYQDDDTFYCESHSPDLEDEWLLDEQTDAHEPGEPVSVSDIDEVLASMLAVLTTNEKE